MRTRVGVAVTAIVAAAGLYAFSPRSMPQFEQTRIAVDKMQLNSIVQTRAGLVAAGELGQEELLRLPRGVGVELVAHGGDEQGHGAGAWWRERRA
mgnify:CR=1 FL=1